MPVALTAAGAVRADAHEFRLTNGGGDIEFPLGGGNYEVWELPPRPMQKRGSAGPGTLEEFGAVGGSSVCGVLANVWLPIWRLVGMRRTCNPFEIAGSGGAVSPFGGSAPFCEIEFALACEYAGFAAA